MAYDETLAARVRELLAVRNDVSERRMFGGLTFMVAGGMCCGINGEELIVRLGPDEYERAVRELHARPTDFTRRPMRGFITVGPVGLEGAELNRWVQRALARVDLSDSRS
jgi:TfoX/Sxy family transcriptional regulator of competence genes